MLSHEIIKFKPTVTEYSRFNYPNKSTITNQQELDKYLATQPKLDDVLMFGYSGNTEVYSLHQINIVLFVQHDFSKLNANFSGKLETHLICQCAGSSAQPWVRWVNPDEYRLVSEADKQRWVNDFVQDYIKRAKATSEMYKEATAQPG